MIFFLHMFFPYIKIHLHTIFMTFIYSFLYIIYWIWVAINSNNKCSPEIYRSSSRAGPEIYRSSSILMYNLGRNETILSC